MPKLTQYERDRLENIKRNEELMKSLGIFQGDTVAISNSSSSKENGVAEVKKQRRKSATSSTLPFRQQPRRSTRLPIVNRRDQLRNSDPIDFLTEPAHTNFPTERKAVLLKQLEAPSLPPVEEQGGFDLEYRAPLPERDQSGALLFEQDFRQCFRPNMTPEEVLRAGSFGGTFFKEHYSTVSRTLLTSSDYLELPSSWISGLDPTAYLTSSTYNPRVNRYGVRAGQSLAEWENSGWVNNRDPRGWFQWYCRFYEGRRTADDWKQVKRWQGVAGVRGRFRRALVKKIGDAGSSWDDETAAPVLRQTLQHWAYCLTQEDYEAYF